ncbi:MAG TPA: PqiC family protein [Burkholderiales bacterium]
MTPKSALIAALLAFPVFSGCGSSPKSSFYTLSSGAAPERAPATAPLNVAIAAVTVPDIVDRPQLVVRVAANQVTINEFARWAAPLKDEIPRVIADNLTRLLNGARVATHPQSGNVGTDYYLLAIGVQRFDSALGDAATVEVLWTVRPSKGGAPRTGRSVVREPAGAAGYDALVAAHSRALAAVSRDIAEALRTMSR